jgi:hypothetical protein
METILVINDEAWMRQTLSLALQAKRFQALEASICRDSIQAAIVGVRRTYDLKRDRIWNCYS